MTYDFNDLMNESASAVLNATPEIKEEILRIANIWEDTLGQAHKVEAELVGQYVSDYDPYGDGPINQLLKEGKDKLHTSVLWLISNCVKDENVYDFPNNLADNIRKIVSEVSEVALTPEMAGQIQTFNDASKYSLPYKIDKGVSNLEEQANHLFMRAFSRRLDEAYGLKQSLTAVPS